MDVIQNHLAKIEDLTVVSRTSVEQYRINPPGAKEISRQLNVSYLLEGSVFRAGEKVQVSVTLIDGTQDEHLWSEVFERDLTDIFDLMSDVANRIARKVKVNLSREVKQRIYKDYKPEISTYDYYLQAREIIMTTG